MESTPSPSSPPPAPPPQWFCHECQRTTTPLLLPNPHCQHCNSDFLEEIEPNSQDPPNEPPLGFMFNDGLENPFWGGVRGGATGGGGFYQIQFGGPGAPAVGAGTGRRGPQGPLAALMGAMGWGGRGGGGGGGEDDPQEEQLPANEGGRVRVQTIPMGNLAAFLGEAFSPQTPQQNLLDPSHEEANNPDHNPFAEGGVTEEERREARERGVRDREEATTPLNYLFSLLQTFGAAGTTNGGRMGDFAIGEGGFQRILEELMEQAAGRVGPQPATEEIIAALPRVKVTHELLELSTIKDCPICQDDFTTSDEELITLPCKHVYHQDCIVTWLKSSGTCPVCRYALVPQPSTTTPTDPFTPVAPVPSTSPQPQATSTSTTIPPTEASRIPGSFPISEEDNRRRLREESANAHDPNYHHPTEGGGNEMIMEDLD